MNEITFNYLAVISAAVASFILGGAYAALFGKQLAKLNGSVDAEVQAKQKPNPKSLIGILRLRDLPGHDRTASFLSLI